jgi:hypothetical protein
MHPVNFLVPEPLRLHQPAQNFLAANYEPHMHNMINIFVVVEQSRNLILQHH